MRSSFRSEDPHRDGKPRPCPECPKYKTCTQLCERVERWVNIDRVGKPAAETNEPSFSPSIFKNSTYSNIKSLHPAHYSNDFLDIAKFRTTKKMSDKDRDLANRAWETLKLLNISKNALDFARLFYRQGKTLAQTAAVLKISSQAAHDRHKQLRRDIRDRFQRFDIWQEIKDDKEDWSSNNADLVVFLFFGGLKSYQYIAKHYHLHIATVYKMVKTFKNSLTNKE